MAKVKNAVAATDSAGTPQFAFHGDGVGTGPSLGDHQCGLDFEQNAFTGLLPGNPLGKLHDSPHGFFRLFRSVARGIGTVDPRSEFVASTAVDRHQHMQPPYRPDNLVTYLAAHHTMTV